MTCGGRALACAMLQEANWSRSSSYWDMSRFKQPSDTLAASSGFGRQSMIASESNQIAESPGRSGRVADHPGVDPFRQPCCQCCQSQLSYTSHVAIQIRERLMNRRQRLLAAGTLLAGMIFWSHQIAAQVLRIAEMNTRQIQALNLQKTVVLIPGGILEEHGPYLPSYTDGYAIDAYTQELAKAIVARPGWTVVLFPQIPLGNDPANTIGGKRIFPGSYPLRMATLRAVYMDLANELGEQGFRWIFLIHNHGAPNHHKALNQASDYFHDVYRGTMVHLFGLKPVFLCCGIEDKMFSAKEREEEGFTVHAGADEQSEILFLRPEFVPQDYREAESLTGRNFSDLVRIAKANGWPGYFGAPRLASAAMGAQAFALSSQKLNEVALQILDGLDYSKIPRYADEMDPLNVAGEGAELEYEQVQEKRELDWLKAHKIR
jgi:creatinine amidohydrolase